MCRLGYFFLALQSTALGLWRCARRATSCVWGNSARASRAMNVLPGTSTHLLFRPFAQLIPVPPPLLGVMILTNNAILHFNNRTIDYGESAALVLCAGPQLRRAQDFR